LAIILAIVFTSSAASVKAQEDDEKPYKVGDIKAGDRVEADPTHNNKWVKCTVTKVNLTYNGDIANYSIRCDTAPYSSVMAYSGHVRLLKEDAKASPQDAPKDNTAQNDATRPTEQPAANKQANKFGTRNPQTCADTKAPARGAITAALAKKYFICQEEGFRSTEEYLVENAVVQVGGGRPYSPRSDTGFADLDLKTPIYPIRGSFVLYQCVAADSSERFYNIGKNCNAYNNRKAEGECYKTTFGDWKCRMNDVMKSEDDKRFNVAPPK
jgi:hypothetical protein